MGGLTKLCGAGVMLAASFACRNGSHSSDAAADALAADSGVVGTYFAADSGHNLGKNWCYSGALVLDSTRHFGSVIKMCSDDGGPPVTETIKGTYHFRTRSVKIAGAGRVRRLYVVLDGDGAHRNSHTLRYVNGSLRFDEPWWMGAGLRALDIPDPVLRKVSASVSADSASGEAASSTPPAARSAAPVKSSAKKAGKSSAAK